MEELRSPRSAEAYVRKEWGHVAKAPLLFGISVAIVTGIAFLVASSWYAQELRNKDSKIALLELQASGATAQRRRWPPQLTGEQLRHLGEALAATAQKWEAAHQRKPLIAGEYFNGADIDDFKKEICPVFEESGWLCDLNPSVQIRSRGAEFCTWEGNEAGVSAKAALKVAGIPAAAVFEGGPAAG